MARTAVLQLKNRLKKEIEILDMLSVLKQIAISEFHFLEKRRRELSQYLRALEAFFGFYQDWGLKQSLFVQSPCKTPCVLAITSDEGFIGALTSDVIQQTLEFCQRDPKTHVVVMGRRGARRLRDHGLSIQEFPGVSSPLEYSAVLPVKRYLLEQYLNQAIGSLRVVYARCHSFTRQEVHAIDLLPFNVFSLDAAQDGAPARRQPDAGYAALEPNLGSLVDYTIALWFGRRLYELFWQSKLSEVAGRTIELSERHDRLSRNSVRTRLRYFRACHEVIDSDIREVFASLSFAKGVSRCTDA